MSSDLQAARLAARMQREIHSLQREPPPGVCAWPSNDTSLTRLEAQIEGPDGTVYAKGIFKLEIQVPERYPFEPPNVRFVTPVYHPNIDNGGRICLDILNLPPKGSWRPSINIATVLTSIRVLLSEPNPDDGLMGDISAEYKRNRADFEIKAKLWTQKYAAQNQDNLDVLPMDVLYPVSKQEPNRVNDSIEIHNGQAEAVAKESGYKNKGSGEFKNNRPSILVKLTEPAGRKLSLAKACATGTPQLLPPNDVLTDCQNKVDDKSKNFCNMQNVNPVLQHNVSDSSSMETPSFSSMLVANNKNNDSLDATKTITIAESRNAQSSSLMGKENYHPYLKVNRLSKLSMSTAVSCDRKNSLKAHKSTETDTRNSETEANVPAEHRNELKHSKMQKIQLQKPRTFATSKYSSLKGDFGSMKTSAVEIEAASDSPTILVSDSESDEEPSPRRSRLSISQRLLAGKRKRG